MAPDICTVFIATRVSNLLLCHNFGSCTLRLLAIFCSARLCFCPASQLRLHATVAHSLKAEKRVIITDLYGRKSGGAVEMSEVATNNGGDAASNAEQASSGAMHAHYNSRAEDDSATVRQVKCLGQRIACAQRALIKCNKNNNENVCD